MHRYNAETPEIDRIPPTNFALDVPGIIDRRGLLPPFAGLAESASALGHNLFILDPDGPLRHVVPFVRSHGRVLPSLGVAAALRASGITPAEVRLDGNRLRYRDRVMPLSWRHVRSSDGVLSYLWGPIDFRGPALLADLKRRTYPTYSFFDVLQSQEQLDAKMKPTVDPAAFRGKIVFVGTTAAGLHDVFETPFANGTMPGINIHAAVADDLLSNRFLDQPTDTVRVAIVLTTALAAGIVAALVPAWWATAATLAAIAAMGWGATLLFAAGHWVNLSQPVLAVSVALFGGVGYRVLRRGAREAENEEAVRPIRLEGHVRAARGESVAAIRRASCCCCRRRFSYVLLEIVSG